jgi:hypothetical protein
VVANWNGSSYGLSLYLTGDWVNGAGGISLFGAGQIKSAFDKKIGERYDVEVVRENGLTSLYVNGVLERAETDLPPAVYNSTSYELASKNGTFNLIGNVFSHSVEVNGIIVRDYRLNDGWASNPLCKNYSSTGSAGDGEYKNLTSSSWSVGAAREFVPDINLVVGHGQSLSIGDQGFPLTHTAETFGSNVRLFNGLAPIGPGYELELQDADIQSLVPFKESGKETHSWGMFNWINSTIQLNNYLYAAGGVGGKTISMLTDVIQDQVWGWKSVEKILNRVRYLGSYDIPFITWIHGEADSLNPVAENYKGDLRGYHDRVKTLSGKNPPLILDQTGKNASNQISEVLLQYADENADAYLAGPKYWLNRLYPEATGIRLHLNAEGYMLQGEMIGECAKEVLNGVDFKPLQPTNLSIVDGSGYKTVKIDFHIPHDGVLTIDTTTLPAAPSLGMRLRTYSGSSAYAATSYNVVGNSIEFTFAEPITTDGLLEFGGSLDDRANTDGVQLPCTNIRGSVGHQSLAVSGVTWYDWAVQFRKIPSDALNRDTDNLWVHGDYSGSMTANQAVLGRNPEWLLDGMSSVRVQCNVSTTSGVAYLWVFNTKVTLVNGVNDVVVNSNATRRMYLQGGASGFVGSVSGITITQV